MDWSKRLAERTRLVEFSGIRKFFELGAQLADPIDLSIGMPDYDAPAPVKDAAIAAIRAGHNRYTPTAGLPELRERIAAHIKRTSGLDLPVLVTSGLSGGLTLALLACVDPGDEVVFCDPYFVSYLQLVRMVGARPVTVSTYPDFAFDPARIESVLTPRTKALIINSPANPTGRIMSGDEIRAASDIARRHDLALISDEIYDGLCYDFPAESPQAYAPEHTIVLRGFGKTYGMTGWRMGYATGPAAILAEMTKFQQFTYVCAPSMAQHAVLAAMDCDVSQHRRDYRRKRDLACGLLAECFEFHRPGGGFYIFPRVPAGFRDAGAFCEAAVRHNVIVIPGNVFSDVNTHFRISYATTDERLQRGCEILCRLARR